MAQRLRDADLSHRSPRRVPHSSDGLEHAERRAALEPPPDASPPVTEPTPAPAPVETTALPPVGAASAPAGTPSTPPPTTSPSPAAPSSGSAYAAISPAQSAVPPTYTPPVANGALEAPPPAAAGLSPSPSPPPVTAAAPPAAPPRSSPGLPPPRPTLVARSSSPPRASAAPSPTTRYRQVPGRVIAGGKVVAATGMYRDYEVQPHDHLDAIARDLGTTRKILVDANHLKAPYALQPGQHLKVPVAKAYQADAGDTLADVAKRFSISPAALADLNDLPEKDRLRAGDRLALPDRFDDRGPTRLAATTTIERVPAPVRQPSYAAPRPTAVAASTYSQPRTDGGPYVPSPAALAAAQRLAVTRSYGPPSYAPGRPSPNAAAVSQPYRPQPYASASYPSPGYQPPPYQGAGFGGRSPAAVAALARGRFIWPVRGAIISGFGVQGVGRRNDGIDIRSPAGSPVRVAAAGEVVYAGNEVPGFGNLVLVKHSDGWVTAYAHLASIGVQMRQSVVQGQSLGDVGATGSAPEAQLHFEVRYAATPTDKPRPVDPMLVLPR